MSTTLVAAMQELSKQTADSWQSTTTGAGTATTLVDSALLAKANDWITDNTWAFLTEEPAGSAAIYDERKISSLDNSDGTLTTLTFAAAPGTGIDYEVHRMFSPSEKRTALVAAARRIFPNVFTEIWNEELVCGNWLSDGSFERWTTSTNPTIWKDTTLTATETTTAGRFRHGSTSCALSGATGTLIQEWKDGIAEFEDLKFLRGRSAVFTCQAWCDTTSSLRLSINDGTTQTYSSYHPGDSAWTEDNPRNDSFYVQQFIPWNATQVTFTIHFTTGATVYVDDARVLSVPRSRLYVGHLGLHQNRPHQVFIEPSYYAQDEEWDKVFDWKVDNDGYLYIPTDYTSDRRLRIRGTKVLDFLASDVSSTAWTATIAIDQPQLEVLVAEAALYLYTQMSLPNFETGQRSDYQNMIAFWKAERDEKISKFGMKSPGATISWGIH